MKARTCWEAVCTVDDLVADSGIAVWTDDGPVAVFYLPHRLPALFAISHTDPFSGSNVLARGITGDINGEPVVASPLYKQHFNLRSGQCLEDESVQVKVYPVLLDGNRIRLEVPVGSGGIGGRLRFACQLINSTFSDSGALGLVSWFTGLSGLA